MLNNRKKQEKEALAEIEQRVKDKDDEMQVLKEMIKGIKLQLKCKSQ